MSEYNDDNFDDSPVKDKDLQRSKGGPGWNSGPGAGKSKVL